MFHAIPERMKLTRTALTLLLLPGTCLFGQSGESVQAPNLDPVVEAHDPWAEPPQKQDDFPKAPSATPSISARSRARRGRRRRPGSRARARDRSPGYGRARGRPARSGPRARCRPPSPRATGAAPGGLDVGGAASGVDMTGGGIGRSDRVAGLASSVARPAGSMSGTAEPGRSEVCRRCSNSSMRIRSSILLSSNCNRRPICLSSASSSSNVGLVMAEYPGTELFC